MSANTFTFVRNLLYFFSEFPSRNLQIFPLSIWITASVSLYLLQLTACRNLCLMEFETLKSIKKCIIQERTVTDNVLRNMATMVTKCTNMY